MRGDGCTVSVCIIRARFVTKANVTNPQIIFALSAKDDNNHGEKEIQRSTSKDRSDKMIFMMTQHKKRRRSQQLLN